MAKNARRAAEAAEVPALRGQIADLEEALIAAIERAEQLEATIAEQPKQAMRGGTAKK
jgi:hypothetical protein